MADHNKVHFEHHQHTYNIMLDANESIEKIPDDEEVLCLDGTLYGNVTRFLNHECHDANFLDILVQKESNANTYTMCVVMYIHFFIQIEIASRITII